ncbi:MULTISPECIES: M50 family metallopeptidase [Brevibacillus]|uniref:M50 family metallopeptidase n=1 Tax=Brevibacillus laterosporus TaxID=1465 RepID=A0AAP3DDL0_BRELA|nr:MULTISPECIES: M50 family metallopeptidase [Brevibacillus]ATO50571.1 stage IV sporulation protein FB [Brevibacillus laterosporus DSM 25]AYB39234.1 stage IV sporulation protein FB [Brevibacillus laterosporus]MBG9775197.1 stage IV sporulation protein FB [Brevibacillus laterosporus]MBG9788965.1 stage IV sporulation protein FB [Brevibacillus laterosporus]MBG9800327.1 stage IV sporulation protein FB [Brevibacillus laterosporus]
MNDFWPGGIRVRIHLLFWLVIGLAVMAGYFIETIALFIIVLIHELGHIAAARELGWEVKEIQLLPFGGVAVMEESPSADAIDEIVVALAGPFMNIVMIFFSLLFWWLGIWSEHWAHFFMKSNMMIALFNLLPMWPLDGGRIVQAVLTSFISYRKAAILSFSSSCGFAILLLGAGVWFFHANLTAVAIYLALTNGQAYKRFPYQFVRFLHKRYQGAPRLDRIEPVRVPSSLSVWEATHKLQKGKYHLFYITGKQGGVLPEENVLYACLVERRQRDWISSLL